ncbi:rho GTPase-activating protein 32-like [Excalfactoria chinensis]|uniref:rho GTPase-activating protein 32-like n=1 Tax=Excalfactoria chinensis TaxID=46218 RepID=UPI003B3B5317
MPPKELSPCWRGKRGFQVGSFPSECVELISGKVPESLVTSLPKPAPKKRGKLPPFLRSVVKARPRRAEQPEPEKEGVFGCDLGEHLLRSGRDVPQVLQSCSEFIEQHGVVRGIYRLSGVTSKIQRLRHEFDSEQAPELSVRDIHSVSSLCKMYFRELPNPLVPEQLYDKFSDAARAATEEERLLMMKEAIQQLPAPHYRTLEYLMRHLASLAGSSSVTNMDAKNLAIVWAPNLLRSQQSQSACVSGGAACLEVQTQAAVVEFLIGNTDVLFHTKSTSAVGEGADHLLWANANSSAVPGSPHKQNSWSWQVNQALVKPEEPGQVLIAQRVLPSMESSWEAQVAAHPMSALHVTAATERRRRSWLKRSFLPALLKGLPRA